ncbi:hypothetical protein BDN72DRAFT_842508 [Pluteus cervinus]|uniref:Uncharacterized protein n=1 Tax=Pluteus cervinus TaxID=181527 RepID=A0ACD3AQB4_9AGAR|nr:hypothetical protein BDN72DRAFT_842508 [Pluteus cervinus]
MDNRLPNLQELFSRGNTPPTQPPFPAPVLQNDSAQSHIDSLFQQLAAPSDQAHTLSQRSSQQSQPQSEPHPTSSSAPVTPAAPPVDEPISTPPAPSSSASAADRQSALLSLLGGPPPALASRPQPAAGTSQPTQVPTPPGPAQRVESSPSHNEAQGKFLLEQLMAGNPPRSNFVETQRNPPAVAVPSPPYGPSPREGDYRQYVQHEQPAETSQRGQGGLPAAAPQPPPIQPQPPSPPKSMFDFDSPFDHLSPSGSVKKKPVPPQPSSVSSGNEDSGWPNITDPKRQSVDNLLEHLTRGPVVQPPPPAYESYLMGSEYAQIEQVQPRPQPIPPPQGKVVPRAPSPRSSPPKVQAQRPQQRPEFAPPQQVPISAVPLQHESNGRRDKESSPGPRGLRSKGPVGQAKASGPNKIQSSPSPQTQTIIFDVSLSLDDIQAPRDSVKSTAIALVKQEPVFLPGTTIGATHWVAYAMTRGRVRVISRSSGDRTLLQLPPVFAPSTSVTDMAVFGNRLAGVTSDGGFVVWELPDVITDDVPGKLLLCVPPALGSEALHSVKWHPKEADTLAVASRDKLYYIDLANTNALHGQPLPQSDLHHIGQVFSVTSPLLAFDFDVVHYAIATISEDSTLTVWNIRDRVPYTSHKIRGEDVPSSLVFVDGGIVVGRKNGTIVQLLSITTKQVLSTIKFVHGTQEDPDMFGHMNYDSRIQTLWVANCRRDSMIAFKLNMETPYSSEDGPRCYFEQVVEFAGPKPTIHFVILTGDADPHGDEAHAACVAAKLVPGDLALVAFSVHSSGVDQVLIRKEWYDQALVSTPAKFPSYILPQAPPPSKTHRPPQTVPQPPPVVAIRARTPPSDHDDNDYGRDEGRIVESKNTKGTKGKNVNWKERDEGSREKDRAVKTDNVIINESNLGQALSREIRKTEESLHNRIGKLIGKEMDKQHQRLEEARAHEQVEDFARQEKILKLISNELTRNTTRVVEVAVKNEVQNSVLPSLENITKNEIKSALNDQVGRGMVDVISQTLPLEVEKLLLRPDISGHFAHILSTNLTPLIERQIKDAVSKTFLPIYSQQSSALHQDLVRELRTEVHGLKSELTAWQTEAFRSHETTIRELEHTVRTLSDQVKYLTMGSQLHHLQQQSQQAHNSPGPHIPQSQGPMTQLRTQNLPPTTQPSSGFSLGSASFPPPQQQQQQQQQQQPPPPPVMHSTWFPSTIAAPQASHPATLPQPPQQTATQQDRSPPIKNEQWDELYLSVLHTQDAAKLRDLLSRTNPELIMPLNGPPLVSQAVILTLIHRLSAVVGESTPNDESFKTSLWWLQRTVALLRPEDKLITDFIPRVIPNVQHLLVATKQRMAILPGGPATLETVRTISEVQETLRRKVMPV